MEGGQIRAEMALRSLWMTPMRYQVFLLQAVEDYRRALELDDNFQRAKEGLVTAQKRQKQVSKN